MARAASFALQKDLKALEKMVTQLSKNHDRLMKLLDGPLNKKLSHKTKKYGKKH